MLENFGPIGAPPYDLQKINATRAVADFPPIVRVDSVPDPSYVGGWSITTVLAKRCDKHGKWGNEYGMCDVCWATFPTTTTQPPAAMRVNIPTETHTNELGGRQGAVAYRADLLPALAVLDVAATLKVGAEKYGEGNWRNITVTEHLNHALIHLLALQTGDTQEPHLNHAACRILFALEMQLCSQ
jgi:hypothetical protein